MGLIVIFLYDDKLHSAKHFLGSGFEERLNVRDCRLEAWLALPSPALWPFFGGPFEGKYRNASVLHDVAYDQKNRPWQQVDRMFYDAMRCSGVGAVEAKTFYFALYRHGRYWKFKEKPEESRETALNLAEVDAIQQWIRQNNPTLDQIDSRAAAR